MEHPPVDPIDSALPPTADARSRSLVNMTATFTRSWGPFLGFLASVVALSFFSLQLARTDTVAVVIGVITVVAMVVAYFSNSKKAA